MTSYRVEITLPAEGDLEQIRRWLMVHAGAKVADRFLVEFLERVGTLEQFPERGSVHTAYNVPVVLGVIAFGKSG